MMKILIPAILVIFLFASCAQKEEPEDVTGPVFFSASGQVGDSTVNIEAGKNSYYLRTSYTNGDKKNTYSGTFYPSCMGCGKEALTITFLSYHSAGNTTFDADSLLNKPRHLFKGDDTIKACLIGFLATPEGTGSVTHKWEFGDSTSSSLANPDKVFLPGTYDVKYSCFFSNGCQSVIIKHFKITRQTIGYARISYLRNTNFIYTFYATSPDSAVNASWDAGDRTTGSGLSWGHTYDTTTIIAVTAKVRTLAGDSIMANEYVRIGDTATGCMANMKVSSRQFIDAKEAVTVIIEWTDTRGRTYSSRNMVQGSENYFRVKDFAPYQKNENGDATTAITAEWDCQLSDGTRTIRMKNMKGRFAIAHP